MTRVEKSPQELIGKAIEAMVASLGGVQKFVTQWHEAVETGTANRKLRSFELLARLIAWSNSQSHEDTGQLSARELQSQFDREVRLAIERDPRIAIRAALELGWTVLPKTHY